MMNTSYIKNKLLQNKNISDFAKAMKQTNSTTWIAGGALTSISTRGVISDYDIYFDSKESCVEGIRYMKENTAHVAFISDKSITYALGNADSFRNAVGEYEAHTKIQFIFYDYYETAEDIFQQFDFSVNCGAYNLLSGEFTFHKDFWLHNSQRFLSFNPKTRFPLISGLRLDKYKQKGYTTSRTEMMKLMFACTSLEINSWEEFSAQVGHLYGYNFVDKKAWEGKEFSMESAMGVLEGVDFSEEVAYTPESNYKYPLDLIEYIVADKPILKIVSDNKEYLPEIDSSEEGAVLEAIEEGKLTTENTTLQEFLGDYVYCWLSEGDFTLGSIKEKTRWTTYEVFKDKKDVRMNMYDLLVKCTYDSSDIDRCSYGDVRFSKIIPVEIIGRKEEVVKWKEGVPYQKYKPQVKAMKVSGSFSCSGFELGYHNPTPDYIAAKFREGHLKAHVKITGGESKYAHNTFVGLILEGGEDIKAKELLLFCDSYNLCFGGNCTISNDGKFSGSYNTD